MARSLRATAHHDRGAEWRRSIATRRGEWQGNTVLRIAWPRSF
jgi:hypothetical protein